METIDARGLSCPQPVLMAKKALSKKEAAYTILVDTKAAKENVTRFAGHAGYNVAAEVTDNEYYTLSLTQK
ncbi:MAG: sulfurtransferase TusA family protein [Acetivibrio ethanolgignens]